MNLPSHAWVGGQVVTAPGRKLRPSNRKEGAGQMPEQCIYNKLIALGENIIINIKNARKMDFYKPPRKTSLNIWLKPL